MMMTVGGRDNYFHCPKCGSCYAIGLHDNHLCVDDSMKTHCPICYEFLFYSIKQTMIMKCGHTMHVDCFEEMVIQNQYRCPICSKSVCNMSRNWERINQEIEATTMPEEYGHDVSSNTVQSLQQKEHGIFSHFWQQMSAL